MPLPPNALGNTDLEGVYADILQFLGPEPLQLFTLQDAIPIVTGVLKFLNTESSQLNILPIEYLFYKMKQASCETAMLSPPESIHVTNSLFNLDPYEMFATHRLYVPRRARYPEALCKVPRYTMGFQVCKEYML